MPRESDGGGQPPRAKRLRQANGGERVDVGPSERR